MTIALRCVVLILIASCVYNAGAQSDRERRLEALSPTDPAGYFLLAEEIAGEARGVEDTRLAQHLYVLALVLDQKRGSPDPKAAFPIAASACLGLADLDLSKDRKRWLYALAGRLDSRYAQRRWDGEPSADQPGEAALLLSEAIGLTLSGDGSLARQRLDDPRVRALLEQTRDLLDRPGGHASSAAFQREALVWPCPECANARSVPDRALGGQSQRFCSTCRGNPGPVISHEALVDYLRYQSLLLRGTQKSWSATLAVGLGRPLLDPEPSEVAPALGVDPARVHYRGGRWLTEQEYMESRGSGG